MPAWTTAYRRIVVYSLFNDNGSGVVCFESVKRGRYPTAPINGRSGGTDGSQRVVTISGEDGASFQEKPALR